MLREFESSCGLALQSGRPKSIDLARLMAHDQNGMTPIAAVAWGEPLLATSRRTLKQTDKDAEPADEMLSSRSSKRPCPNDEAANMSPPRKEKPSIPADAEANRGSELILLGYADLLNSVKERVRSVQVRAAVAVNAELVRLYWFIGSDILRRQVEEGWGAKVIDRLSADLGRAFPEMKGFSARNLKYMRAFADAYPEEPIVQGVLAQITWYHHIALLDKVKRREDRLWYARQAIQHGWSRNVLVHHIETALHARQGQAITNFDRVLPAPQSDLAQGLLKDPYVFDFLSLGPEAHERDLERGLLEHIRKFLLELGTGFAFVGSQYHLEVSDQDFYIDLLFYHFKLRCFVVIDLKMGAFKPEYAGKMNFYLSAIDDSLRHPSDEPSIGIILCKGRDRLIVEYALRDMTKPIGVAAHRLLETLPKQLEASLPSADALTAELAREEP
jgi:predicted nuclease of restriction endonuclease-like (RecB) superfamily